MNQQVEATTAAQIRAALTATDPSTRLKAAMTAGADPRLDLLTDLVARCGVEPDFYVREMLTWAIIQRPAELTVPLLRDELSSSTSHARSQALHTLSKIGVPEAWPWVFPHLLTDEDDEVARAAWRVAVGIVPSQQILPLLDVLVSQLGRGDMEVMTSLARAFVELSCLTDEVAARLQIVASSGSGVVAQQAAATLIVVNDPGASFPGAFIDA